MLPSKGRHPPQEFLLQLLVCHAHSLRVPPDRCTKKAVTSGYLRRVPSPHASRVSEQNSSRKLTEQARLPTPRYRISMRVYGCGFPRMSPLGFSANKGTARTPSTLSLGARSLPKKKRAYCSCTPTMAAGMIRRLAEGRSQSR